MHRPCGAVRQTIWSNFRVDHPFEVTAVLDVVVGAQATIKLLQSLKHAHTAVVLSAPSQVRHAAGLMNSGTIILCSEGALAIKIPHRKVPPSRGFT